MVRSLAFVCFGLERARRALDLVEYFPPAPRRFRSLLPLPFLAFFLLLPRPFPCLFFLVFLSLELLPVHPSLLLPLTPARELPHQYLLLAQHGLGHHESLRVLGERAEGAQWVGHHLRYAGLCRSVRKTRLSGRIVGLNRGSIVHGRRCERGKPPSSDGAGVLGRGGRTLAEPQEPLVDAPSGMRGVVCIVVCVVTIHPSSTNGDVSRRRGGAPPH